MTPGPDSASRPRRSRVLIVAPGEIAYDTNAGHARLWAVLHALIAEGADVGYFGVWPLAHRRYADAMDELGVRLLGERQPMIDLPAEVAERREPRNATARRFTDVLAAFAPTHVYFYLHFTAVELLDLARSAAAGAAHLLDAVDVLFRQDWGSQGSPMPEPDELALYRRCNAVLVDSHADAVALRSPPPPHAGDRGTAGLRGPAGGRVGGTGRARFRGHVRPPTERRRGPVARHRDPA